MSRYLTFEEACEHLNVPASTLYKWTRTGRVPHIKRSRAGSRCLFRADWFDAWDEGADLVEEQTRGGGRIVRPKAARRAAA